MGCFPLLGITLNNVTTIVPPLVMALALADSVHIFAHLDKKLLDHAPSPAKAMERILQRVITPCFLTSLTTAVGFASLIVSDIPPIKEFGYVASLGMIFEFLFSFMLLPPLMLMCRPDSIYTEQRMDTGMGAFLDRLSTFVRTRARHITALVSILALGAVWAASTIRVETNLLEYFKTSSPLRQELSYIEPRLSGVGTGGYFRQGRGTGRPARPDQAGSDRETASLRPDAAGCRPHHVLRGLSEGHEHVLSQ